MASKAGKAVLPRPANKPQQKGSFTFALAPSKTDKPPYHSSGIGIAPSKPGTSHDNCEEEPQHVITRQGSTSTFEDRQGKRAEQHAMKVEDRSSARASVDSNASSISVHQHEGQKVSIAEHSTDVSTISQLSQLALADSRPAGGFTAQQQANIHDTGEENTARPTQKQSKPESADSVRSSPSSQPVLQSLLAGDDSLSKDQSAVGEQLQANDSQHLLLPASSSPTAGGASPKRRESMDFGLKAGPVFVPIVLTMDETDHELLVEGWLQRRAVSY